MFVQHLATNDYHPRSDAHSNVMCRAILDDLVESCPPLAERAKRGELVAKLNHSVKVSHQDWNIDLAIGPPAGSPSPPVGEAVRDETPVTVEIAIEAKAIMTEHGKARRNRLRDLQAFHDYAHRYNQKTVAVGTVAVNVSPVFWSPLRSPVDITLHDNIDRLGPATVELFRSLPLRNAPADPPGFEAASVIVIRHDNLSSNPSPPLGAPESRPSSLVTRGPSPQVGDPLHYATMIRRICTAYRDRWT